MVTQTLEATTPTYIPVFGAPTLDEAHAYCAHARQLIDRLEALVDRLSQQRRKLLVVEDLQVTTCSIGG